MHLHGLENPSFDLIFKYPIIVFLRVKYSL